LEIVNTLSLLAPKKKPPEGGFSFFACCSAPDQTADRRVSDPG